MSNRIVTDALLQGPIFVAGVGQLPQQLSTLSDRSGKIKSLTMEWRETYLNVAVNGVECGIPHANVQVVTFAKESESTAKSKMA